MTGRPDRLHAAMADADLPRRLAIAGAAGLFLALIGPFGTGTAPLWERVVYWVGLCAGGTGLALGIGAAMHLLFDPKDRRPLILGLATALLMTPPSTLVVWWVTESLFGWHVMSGSLIQFSGPGPPLAAPHPRRCVGERAATLSGTPAPSPARRRPLRCLRRGPLSAPAHLQGLGPDPAAPVRRHRRTGWRRRRPDSPILVGRPVRRQRRPRRRRPRGAGPGRRRPGAGQPGVCAGAEGGGVVLGPGAPAWSFRLANRRIRLVTRERCSTASPGRRSACI